MGLFSNKEHLLRIQDLMARVAELKMYIEVQQKYHAAELQGVKAERDKAQANFMSMLLPDKVIFTKEELEKRDAAIFAKALDIKAGGYVLYTKEDADELKKIAENLKRDINTIIDARNSL